MAKILASLPPPSHGATATIRPVPHFRDFMITLRHTTLGRTPLDEWLAQPSDLPENTSNRQDMYPQRDSNPQPQQASGRRPVLERAATGIGGHDCYRD